jgi:histidine phosphotransferase ChpT
MLNETRLIEMLCTRLCHDLTGPIGAVNNGAEFLDDEGFDMQNEAVKLIVNSANEAVSRLQFYRQAYGRVSESGEASLSDKKKLAEDFFASTKITLDWPDAHTDASGISVNQKMGRLILNLLIIAGASLIRGGTLSVRLSQSESGEKELRFSAQGETVKLDPELVSILKGQGDEAMLTPKTSQPLLTMALIKDIGAELAFEVTGESFEMVCRQQAMVATAAAV